MEKIIWVVDFDRKAMIYTQRQINSQGSMRAVAILSREAAKHAIRENQEPGGENLPALILFDYDTCVKDEFEVVKMMREQMVLAGVPIFFMMEERNAERDEVCFERGAIVVVSKPFTTTGLLRIERIAWQHEVTKNYEKMLQKQAYHLQHTKEVVALNEQLKRRNELLYKVFGRYFPDEIVREILDDPSREGLGGEKKEVTVLMSDLRGFTAISEGLDPEEVKKILNFYFDRMVAAILKYHGVIIELLGDGILAVFGASVSEKNHTEEAIAAAIMMQNAMEEVQDFCRDQGYPSLEMGIGIHRGDVFIGNVGSESMMRYNVVGRIVNECSRIEGFSVGGQTLVSREAIAEVKCPVKKKNYQDIQSKGTQRPLQVVEVIGIEGEYQMVMNNVDVSSMTFVTNRVILNIFPIEEKIVSEQAVSGELIFISKRRALVRIETVGRPLPLYTDVEIFAVDENGHALFTGVFGKVVAEEKDEATLHFTRTSRGFENYVDDLKRY